jgi:protein involved in sex pheromone biosynthesis
MELIEQTPEEYFMNQIYAITESWQHKHYEFYKVYKVTNKLVYLRKLKSRSTQINSSDSPPSFYGWHKMTAINQYHTDWNNKYTEKRVKISVISNWKPNCEYDYEVYPD